MNYAREFFFTHIKYWWLYLIAFVVFFVAMFFSAIMVVGTMTAMKINPRVILFASSFVAALIGSSPLIFVNHKIAQNFDNKNVALLTFVNHMVTTIFFYVIAHISFYWLFIDFRL